MHFSYDSITLALLSLRGIGSQTVRGLWDRHPAMASAKDILDSLCSSRLIRSNSQIDLSAINKALDDSQALLERCVRENIRVTSRRDDKFPPLLRSIPASPLILFSMGQIECLLSNCIAIIGTRNPTDYGLRCARKMAATLVEDQWVIVSGLAEGCDTAGHEGCLKATGKTAAFLAHGFGKIYPASNKELAHKILDTGGCLVTEYPPGQPATRGSFVERDRLQSGSSRGIVVIETDVKGGTMHTVRHATEQKRPIAALQHPNDLRSAAQSQGNQFLINEKGAIPLKDKADLLQFAHNLCNQKQISGQTTEATRQSQLI